MNTETITAVTHWTDRLMSIRTTRGPALRFQSGQFTMIGLQVDGKPLLRAYSIASPHYEDHLEFYSIKVQEGPLTSRLQHVAVGDQLIVGPKPVGTLMLDNLLPGRNLWFLATGTGIAPFLSLMRDPAAYERYENVVLVHGCREYAELAYGAKMVEDLCSNELISEFGNKLVYRALTTRETSANQGRITDMISDGRLWAVTGLPELNPAQDRVMICGSTAMTMDLTEIMLARGFVEGSAFVPGGFVYEKSFVDR
jgi:ferredoxin/flavodoxin---NADP+ reductase